MVGLEAPSVGVLFSPVIPKSPLEDVNTQWNPTGKQANWGVCCDASWFDFGALECSSQVNFYFCRRKANGSHPSLFQQVTAASVPGTIPRPLAARAPPPCQAPLSTSGDQASCNLLSFYCSLGSHASRCQMWPEALAVKCPLPFTVWIQKWRAPLSRGKPAFLQELTIRHFTDQPSPKNTLKGSKKSNVAQQCIVIRQHLQGSVNDQTPCPPEQYQLDTTRFIYKLISHSWNHSYFLAEIFMPEVLWKPIYILQNPNVALGMCQGESDPEWPSWGTAVGYWDSNGLPWLREILLPQRPGILKNFSHFVSSEEEADCGFNRGSCWRHRGKNEKTQPPQHPCRAAVSQTETDLEPLKDAATKRAVWTFYIIPRRRILHSWGISPVRRKPTFDTHWQKQRKIHIPEGSVGMAEDGTNLQHTPITCQSQRPLSQDFFRTLVRQDYYLTPVWHLKEAVIWEAEV